jgi:hypothetical protein
VVILAIAVWMVFPGGHKEERFIAWVTDALQGNSAPEGEISQKEMETLRRHAGRLKLSPERRENLFKMAKSAYLDEKRQTLLQRPPGGHEITAEELTEFCKVAEVMDMRAAVNECAGSLEDMRVYLRRGEFGQARQLLYTMPDNPEKIRILSTMNTPLGVDVKFQYQKGTEGPSPLHPLDASNLHGLTLHHKDNYRLFISVSYDKTYVYIFQKDRYGQITRLFPDPIWSRVDNPIQVGVTYRIPPGEKEWLFLNELPPDQKTPIQETLYIVASPWPAEDLEVLYGDLHRVTSQESREELLQQFLNRLKLRADDALKAVYHKQFSFNHEG